MFYKIIKEFFIKKIINKGLLGYRLENSEDKIQSIGVLVDESDSSNKIALLKELTNNGFALESIKVLVFKNKIKKNEVIEEPFYSLKNFGITGKISKKEVQEFINAPFDLLINYYDESKSGLDIVAKKSKAKFKVGFSSIDERINHLIISSKVENQKEFISEMVKYLRILKKV